MHAGLVDLKGCLWRGRDLHWAGSKVPTWGIVSRLNMKSRRYTNHMKCWLCTLLWLIVCNSWIVLRAAARQSNWLELTLGFSCDCFWSLLFTFVASPFLKDVSVWWPDMRCNSITASKYVKCIITTDTYSSSEQLIGCSGRISIGIASRQRWRWLSSLPRTLIRYSSDLVCELAEYSSVYMRLPIIASVIESWKMS